jgi:hypothetical protein
LSSKYYPEIELTLETKSRTNNFCQEKVLKGFKMAMEKEERVRLSSARIHWNKRLSSKSWKSRDRPANYANKILFETNLKTLPEENVCL